jgi:hypothetical protein
VTPVNLQSSGSGTLTQATADVQFWFETLTQVQAKAD